jgi:gluconokinase
VLGKKVWVPQSPEASALGAAALALYRMGEIRDLVEVKKWVSIIGEHQPNAKNHEVYQSLFSLYDRLAHKLIDEFHEIAEFQRSKIGRG